MSRCGRRLLIAALLASAVLFQLRASHSTLSSVLNLALVCLGGAAGSALRYLVGLSSPFAGTTGLFGWTFTVNAVGSLLLGMLAVYFANAAEASQGVRLALTTGLMGGFTTYSTFSLEAFELLDGGRWAEGALYLAATLVVCLLCTGVGVWTGRALFM